MVALCVLLVACGDGETASTADAGSLPPPTSTVETTVPSRPTTPSTTPSTSSAASSGTTGAAGEAIPLGLLEPLLLDAASRAGVTVGDVTIVETEFRDFPDSSLGCPQPGMMYTQVITPGYRVVLEADGAAYDYRMNRRGTFRLCENPGAIPDVRTPSTVIPTSSTAAGD